MIAEETVWSALSTVMDPELPFSVVDLGLVYGVHVSGEGAVRVQLTLTTRGCPLVQRISQDVSEAVRRHAGAGDVAVEVVWDPPWNPGMASERVRRELGWS